MAFCIVNKTALIERRFFVAEENSVMALDRFISESYRLFKTVNLLQIAFTHSLE
ncbi:hypothetical protein VCHA53O466_10465 [Vibrio chagasii]|nr:hypothetical protein VCHA53O466_10465 [Vibrio chagasii]